MVNFEAALQEALIEKIVQPEQAARHRSNFQVITLMAILAWVPILALILHLK